MTGLDCLKEELYNRGMTRQQVESKVVPVVLDIVAGEVDKFTNYATADKELSERNMRLNAREVWIKTYEDEIKTMCNKTKSYVDGFFDALTKCETPEGRDRLKAAQTFINTVNVQTPQNNTAYIFCLGAILSGCGADIALKKIMASEPYIDDDRKARRF